MACVILGGCRATAALIYVKKVGWPTFTGAVVKSSDRDRAASLRLHKTVPSRQRRDHNLGSPRCAGHALSAIGSGLPIPLGPAILSRMGTKSRESICGASIRAAAERAAEARKEADRLACEGMEQAHARLSGTGAAVSHAG